MMRVKVCGKYWDFRFVPLRTAKGDCDPPTLPGKQIRVDSRLDGEERLEVIIHELMHASDWKVSEEHITEAAADISAILWRLGYTNELETRAN